MVLFLASHKDITHTKVQRDEQTSDDEEDYESGELASLWRSQRESGWGGGWCSLHPPVGEEKTKIG